MVQVYQKFVIDLKYCPTIGQNGEGVKHVGPCILMVLCRPAVKMVKFKVSWHKKIDNIVNDSKLFMMHWNPRKGSSRLARYVVHRGSADCFLGYTCSHYGFVCRELLDQFSIRFQKRVLKLSNRTWKMLFKVILDICYLGTLFYALFFDSSKMEISSDSIAVRE